MKIYEDVIIVLISFKSKDKIKNFVKKISKKFRIIIIDNSYDNELKKEIETADNVSIYLKKNIGYGKAVNFAKSKISTKYFLLCNPDLENVDNYTVEKFYRVAESLYPNFLCLGPSFNKKKINKNFYYSKKDKISGACMFFSTLSFNKLNGFDENIFLYFEEDDLCRRGNILKLFSYQLNNLFIKHEIGTSASNTNEIEKKKIKELTLWHFIWSKFYFYKKHHGNMLSIIFFAPVLCRILFKILLTKLLSDKENNKKYRIRLSGLISSILGKKSYKRINLNNF
jgi:N-acetylglucosaminyl-diphospho-decaprenol L-rhamnosyltransferase